ncbi:MAG: sigma-54-dependent transcriptional regulator [Clostridia bacterium]
MKKILMIDDDVSFLNIYSDILKSNGYSVDKASSVSEGMKLLENTAYSVVILDIVMPEMNGVDALRLIKKTYRNVLVIMLTGEGSIAGAVETMEIGAYTYLIKPIEIDQLLLNIMRAIEYIDIHDENVNLRSQILLNSEKTDYIGNSESVKSLKECISKVAPTNTSVLITGESGTGKEIIATLIHVKSARSNGAMIKVNCAAISENLLETELFGHEKGAFTGAMTLKRGRFEMASNGTLFLDEIGELSMRLQTKLLRVLQEKEFERVGGVKTIYTDFRLISATNKDLAEEIKRGNFREDLYYRINVVPINSMPLRERKEDIPIIINYYLKYFCEEMKKSLISASDEVLKVLSQYEWKGNVRELKNLIERLVVFSGDKLIELDDLPNEYKIKPTVKDYFGESDYQEAKKHFEKVYFEKMLKEYNWNISLTASKINIARKNLQLKIKQLGISK